MLLALFDFLVAAMAIFAAFKARRGGLADLFSQGGYAAIAVAALIGTAKYAAFPALAPYHAIASHIATVIGVPFAAVGFFLVTRQLPQWAMAFLAILVVGAGVACGASAAACTALLGPDSPSSIASRSSCGGAGMFPASPFASLADWAASAGLESDFVVSAFLLGSAALGLGPFGSSGFG